MVGKVDIDKGTVLSKTLLWMALKEQKCDKSPHEYLYVFQRVVCCRWRQNFLKRNKVDNDNALEIQTWNVSAIAKKFHFRIFIFFLQDKTPQSSSSILLPCSTPSSLYHVQPRTPLFLLFYTDTHLPLLCFVFIPQQQQHSRHTTGLKSSGWNNEQVSTCHETPMITYYSP